jgi:fructose/tagatose bisphosphate aldolase
MTYDVSRALFRAAKAKDAGAFIFEIARSEIGYTEQRPHEYAAVVLGAAIREGWKGPVFLQGDHFQASAKKMQDAPEKEVQALKDLIAEAVAANFLNIDIDCSTLVDLSKPTTREQQRVNGTLGAELTAVVRKHEPKGTTISVGGEIGEVGGKNSTEEELRAYMEEYRAGLEKHGLTEGISKVSVQTGTTHGGIPLAGGGVAQVKIDFGTLERLSVVSREEFGMAGAVQHGASTLPAELFGKFPEVETAEIHLATEFQNLVLDHKAFPKALRDAMFAHCVKSLSDERKATDTDDTFFYKTRKKANGPFKRDMWSLPADVRGEIAATLEEKFRFLFDRLKATGTAAVVAKHVKPAGA